MGEDPRTVVEALSGSLHQVYTAEKALFSCPPNELKDLTIHCHPERSEGSHAACSIPGLYGHFYRAPSAVNACPEMKFAITQLLPVQAPRAGALSHYK